MPCDERPCASAATSARAVAAAIVVAGAGPRERALREVGQLLQRERRHGSIVSVGTGGWSPRG